METRRLNLLGLPRRNPELLPKILRWQVLREERRPGEIKQCLEFSKSSETKKARGCGSGSRGATIIGRKKEKKAKETRAVRGGYRCGITGQSGDVGHVAVNCLRLLAHNWLCALSLALVPFLLYYLSEMLQASSPRLDMAKVRRH